MINLGRFALGRKVPLFLASQTGAGVATWPDATPTIAIFDASDMTTVIETVRPGAKNPTKQTGLFHYGLKMGSSYAINKTYIAAMNWTIGAVVFGDTAIWQTIPGGSTDGAVIGGVFMKRPEANVVGYVLDSGKLKTSNNPR